jgi:glutathione S-transferase
MKLSGFGPMRSLRALWGLKELDTDFEFVPVNLLTGEHKRPDFLRLNPAGKVPWRPRHSGIGRDRAVSH